MQDIKSQTSARPDREQLPPAFPSRQMANWVCLPQLSFRHLALSLCSYSRTLVFTSPQYHIPKFLYFAISFLRASAVIGHSGVSYLPQYPRDCTLYDVLLPKYSVSSYVLFKILSRFYPSIGPYFLRPVKQFVFITFERYQILKRVLIPHEHWVYFAYLRYLKLKNFGKCSTFDSHSPFITSIFRGNRQSSCRFIRFFSEIETRQNE